MSVEPATPCHFYLRSKGTTQLLTKFQSTANSTSPGFYPIITAKVTRHAVYCELSIRKLDFGHKKRKKNNRNGCKNHDNSPLITVKVTRHSVYCKLPIRNLDLNCKSRRTTLPGLFKNVKKFSRPSAANPRFALAIFSPFCLIKSKTPFLIDTPPCRKFFRANEICRNI